MHQTLRVLGWLVLISFVFLFAPKLVNAQVVINEVSPVSDPEWVELYNTSATEISLNEYSLNFGSDSQNKKFCENEKISANGYKLIILTSSWLSNTGDGVRLKRGDDEIDFIGYGTGYTLGKPSVSGSIARIPDGGSWVLSEVQSQSGENVNFDCPTIAPTTIPTQTPTSTPNSTQTPTVNPTAVVTVKPVATKTPTPKPTPTETLEAEETELPSFDITSIDEPVATDEPVVMGSKTENKSGLISLILIGLGVLFLGYGGYMIYNKRHEFFEKRTIG